jgi:hypothetical protein
VFARRAWPEPQRFPQFLDKMGQMMGASYDWSANVKKLPISGRVNLDGLSWSTKQGNHRDAENTEGSL